MRQKLSLATNLAWCSAALLLLTSSIAGAQSGDMKLRAYLVWGTDDTKPPEGKNYKPVEPDIDKKLKSLPLKYKHYFEVNPTNFNLAASELRKVPVSEKCELDVKSLGN